MKKSQLGIAGTGDKVYTDLKAGVPMEIPARGFALWRDLDAECNPEEVLAYAR
jgi:hypothetical protein